jgi:membrane protein implicated in regulation of membrane protease activity
MEPWALWLAAAVVLCILEVVTGVTLVFLMLAAGSLAAAATAALTGSDWLPWVVFSAGSAAMVVFVRPVAHRHLRQPARLRSGTAALIGADAEVLAEVTGRDGRVKLRGELWSARSYDPGSTFEVGQTVQVLAIDGATALVG